MIIIVSSPSGGGKNTVLRELKKIYKKSCLSVNTTSRQPREKEKDGQDYFFVSKTDFENKIKNHKLIEYNFYNGNYYGVEKKQLFEKIEKNKIVFVQIDVNGKKSFDREKIKHLSFFLLPDSLQALEERIKNRGGLDKKQIAERLKIAKKELKQAKNYNYQITNRQGHLKETVLFMKKIIDKELATLDKS